MDINIIIICVVALTVHVLFRRDFDKGVAAAVFFLILLPREAQISLPGALPVLTGHRVVLFVLLINVYPRFRRSNLAAVSVVVGLLYCEGISRFLSIFPSIDGGASFKAVVDFWLETVMFFVLMTCALTERRAIRLVAWSSLLALTIVAAIGIFEKYSGTNIAAAIIPDMVESPVDITATFRHRILFGYAMAMGFPLALALRGAAESGWRRWLPKLAVLMLLAACYFSHSRGPWVGCALAGGVLAVAAGRTMRRKLVFLGVVGVLLLASRPGVYESIDSLWTQSFDQSTVKGRSTDYRLVLWKIAFTELTKSIDHTFLGYGGHSTELMDVSEYFDRGAGGLAEGLGHSSWDSQLASDLMQFGFLGFGIELFLLYSIFKVMLRAWRSSKDERDRDFMVACGAVTLVFFWAMSTVAIFNPQLDFLFWAVVAMAGQYPQAALREEQKNELDDRDAEEIARPEANAWVARVQTTNV